MISSNMTRLGHAGHGSCTASWGLPCLPLGKTTNAAPVGAASMTVSWRRLRGQELPGADVDRRVPELRHGTGLDLADALPRELEALANLLEGPRLAAVEAEAQAQD